MNSVIIDGRLTKDIVLKSTTSGKHMADFTIANNDDKQNTEFVNCRCWEKTADYLQQYSEKGCRVIIEGKWKTDRYTDKNGQNRTNTYVLVQRAQLIDYKAKETAPASPQQPQHEWAQLYPAVDPTEFDNPDMPF